MQLSIYTPKPHWDASDVETLTRHRASDYLWAEILVVFLCL